MNTPDAQRSVRDYAVTLHGATRLFEGAGIDYCCGGDRPLSQACAEKGVPIEQMLSSLAALEAEPTGPSHDPATDPEGSTLSTLIDEIVATHHVFTRDELGRIELLFEKVCAAHGARHPELDQLRDLFRELAAELLPHMLREERVLFPYIKHLEASAGVGTVMPTPPFGTVRNPIRMMEHEHEEAGRVLASMRAHGADYVPPSDACASFRALYEAMSGLEHDLYRHIHLENNILFPKAQTLET